MPLYQNSVLKKHLAAQDEAQMQEAFEAYSKYFLDAAIQDNIRNSKEEQFQEGFLRELFVNILGYTINPNPDFNLTTELKNIKDAKKTDGAILQADGSAIAVIELKGTDTKDLDKVTDQAFNYKNNQPECVYVVTSNFEKLRFYIHNAVEHEEFNLFKLTYERFKLLWLFMQKDNLLGGIPQKVKEESLQEEEKVTKRLYKDYSAFKTDLWNNMCQNNPEADELELYKKSQKLLDRFLFIFFAEDKGLLPPNMISTSVEKWQKLADLDYPQPLYEVFKQLFGFINTGRKGKQEATDIFAYNGGLFLADELLDNVVIGDDVLKQHVMKLTAYDFATEIDTNILGHIFEHSLNDIENVRAKLAGEEVDKSKTKRKKDGVFYTPKYITKYILDNTVGKLCEEKKAEIGIDEEEFAKDRKGRKTTTLKKLDAQLKDYREWLLQLTICDPACGSGAFLNQALEFLMAEHRYVDELESQLLGYAMVFPDVENHILERNIYGVDINEESVEIARLSLWLRTAKKGRKLTSLSSNIKVGNSLIDAPEVAGDLAFNWQEQFPTVFEKGGFDVVIGNPPYGAQLDKVEKEFFKKNYTVSEYNYDTYNFFFEQSLKTLKPNSLLGFITPNTFLVVENGVLLRRLLFQNNTVERLYEAFDVFPDAVVEPISIVVRTTKPKSDDKIIIHTQPRKSLNVIEVHRPYEFVFGNESLIINYRETPLEARLADKLTSKSKRLSSYAEVNSGVILYEKGKGEPVQDSRLVKEKPYNLFASVSPGSEWLKLVRGTQVKRYNVEWDSEFVKYGRCLAAPRRKEIFLQPKILVRRTDDKLLCSYDDSQMIGVKSVHSVQLKTSDVGYDYLLALMNSKLLNWWFRHTNFHMVGKPMAEVKLIYVERLPLLILKSDARFDKPVSLIVKNHQALSRVINSLLQLLQSKFPIDKPSKKLQNWPELDFKGFEDELKKKKVKLSLEESEEWLTYFNKKKTEANALQAEIDRIDKQIDQMVYELYGLSEEEIEIVEGS